MADVKVYGFAQSTYVRTVRLVLEEKAVDYDLVPVEFGSDALLAVQPFGKIPALAHGGFGLYETSAICRYIDETFDGLALTPSDAQGRARMEQWISAVNGYYDTDMIRHVVIERVAAPRMGREPDEAKIADALPRIEREVEILEAWLDDPTFLAGRMVTIADFFLTPIMAYFSMMPEGEPLVAGKEAIQRWWQHMQARPSFAATQPPPPQ
jgi:glutathione S-transferase